MSESLTQLILKHARETAENTRVIRKLLEQHFEGVSTEEKPRTEVHDNLDQFVIEATDEPLAIPEPQENTLAVESEYVTPSKTDAILARFKKRVGG